ncbi:MAG: hypothetical protein FVQ79_09955 [Planctomycetes bacterium]|nr:hypothetical protein [Planctomycetota bacterium]
MLKQRLIFGTLMAIAFVGILLTGAYLDGSINSANENKPIQATLLCILIALLAIPAQLEMASLVRTKNASLFTPLAIVASVLLATSWYVKQFFPNHPDFQTYYIAFTAAFTLLAAFFYQARKFGTQGTVINCSVTFFSVFYLGFLSSFVLGIRVDFGLWPLFMFIFVVKSSDIGAYTLGKLFGKHKFSPRISPGKTWEGMAGAVLFAAVVSVIFSNVYNIMNTGPAILFGILFAFLGQLGDLAESMIKRDVEIKDSSKTLPGFGGVLDVIDSPLATAPIAYAFFMLAAY